VIVSLVKLLVVLIIVGKAAQLLLAQRVVIQLVLEYHAGVEQSLFKNLVAFGHLFGRKRYLFQVILTLVRVVLRAVERVFY